MNAISQVFRCLDRGLSLFQRAALVMLSVCVISAMLLDVLCRYIFNTSIWGMEQVLGNVAVWLYMLGAAFATQERSHIKADLVHLFTDNEKARAIVRSIAASVSVFISIVMLVWAYHYVAWSMSTSQRIPALGWPAVYFQAAFVVAAFLMALFFFAELLDNLKKAFRRKPLSGEN